MQELRRSSQLLGLRYLSRRTLILQANALQHDVIGRHVSLIAPNEDQYARSLHALLV